MKREWMFRTDGAGVPHDRESDCAATCHSVAVIDTEDREQVERLWRAWRDLAPDHRLAQDNMQAALREFADPTPPRPPEPTAAGAVVEDRTGNKWVRICDASEDPVVGPYPEQVSPAWRHRGHNARHWDKVTAVRVLSEGVTE